MQLKRLPFFPSERAVKVLGGRWKPVIIYYLQSGGLRLSDLERIIAGVSQKVLIQQLRALETHALVQRRVRPEGVSEYYLTAFGLTALPLIEALAEWGRCHAGLQREQVATRCAKLGRSQTEDAKLAKCGLGAG